MPKRSEVYFHDGNLITLAGSLVFTDKKFYALMDLPHKAVFELQRDSSGKKVCLVRDLDPFPPTTPAPTSDTLGDRLLSTALRERGLQK